MEETTLPDRNVNQYVPMHLSVVLAGKSEANLVLFLFLLALEPPAAETGLEDSAQERTDTQSAKSQKSALINTCNQVVLQFEGGSYCKALRSRNWPV